MNYPAAQPHPSGYDFSKDDDSFLLLYMAEAGSNRPLAEAAFSEFVGRHWRTMIGFCREQRLETFQDGAEDFVDATFLRAFERASSYTVKSTDPEQIHRDVQNWLFTILQRIFLDARRRLLKEIKARKRRDGDRTLPEAFEPSEIDCKASPMAVQSQREATSARRRTLTDRFLQTLNGRDRAIFVQTQDFIDPETGATEPPKAELEALASQFGIPSDHIRVYRQRILSRLRKFIEKSESNQS